jgi:PGF-pre-PGF domain-containing protein
MATNKVWGWLAVFLFAFATVFAAEDFTAAGTGRILGFACSPAEGTITVTNTGDVQSAYELRAEGRAKDWVMFVPETFILNPGQTAAIQEYFAIPCDAEDEFLDIAVLTSELELLLTQDIVVQTPNNVVLTPLVYSQEVLPCDPAEFTFLLQNPAEFAETYKLKVLDAPETTTVSEEMLTLLPHTNETISVTARPKDCTLSGEFAPVLQVKTEKSKLAAEIEMFLRIQDSDIATIAPGIESIRAGYSAQEARIEVVNEGNRVTSYLLRIEAPEWVSLQPEELTIQPRDSEDAKLILQPNENIPMGSYDVTITAIVEATGKEYTKELTIKLTRPTFWNQLFEANLPLTIAAIVVLVIIIILIYYGVKKWKSPEFQARLAERRIENERRRQEKLAEREQRKRQREEERQERVKAREDAKRQKEEDEEKRAAEEARAAEKRQRELEKERVRAQMEYDRELRREHLVIPKDDIIHGALKAGRKYWKLLVLFITLILVLLGLAYSAALEQYSRGIVMAIIALLAVLFLHKMRRRRMARARWKLALAGEDLQLRTGWKRGITQLTFRLNSVVEKLRVVVRRSRPSLPPAAEKVYQTFTITPNVDAGLVADGKVLFSVKRSWLIRNGIAPSAVRLQRLECDRWQSIVAEPLTTDDKYIHYSAEIGGFGEFAIVGKPAKRAVKREERQFTGWIAGGVFAIAVIIALIALFVWIPSPEVPTVGIPHQTWKQNQEHTLDLGKYFKDPDGDVLTFTATRTEHIDVTIVGDKAVLTPDFGWSGTEQTVFMADDGKGGISKSNKVSLTVEAPVIPSSWKRYSGPVFVIALIIVVILALILYRRQIARMVGLSE